MIRAIAVSAALVPLALSCSRAPPGISNVRVAFCARNLSAGAAPFAVAIKMGWFRDGGIQPTLVALPGSSDCVKNVASGEILFALPSLEPQAAARLQGVRGRTFYTAYQGNVFRLAVPADSPIRQVGDLRGKTIGVASLGAGVLFAKALAAAAGMDPERDVRIVTAGEGAQTAAMLRSRQVDALSQFDTQFAMVENAGVKLRPLETSGIDRFPGNGFFALEDALGAHRREAVALARGYAKGTIFTINNPAATVRMLYEVFPETRPTGKDETAAIRDDIKVVQARIPNWQLERSGVKRWGENLEANYAAYLEFLFKWGAIQGKVSAKDLITNDLIDEINDFDANETAALARNYGSKG